MKKENGRVLGSVFRLFEDSHKRIQVETLDFNCQNFEMNIQFCIQARTVIFKLKTFEGVFPISRVNLVSQIVEQWEIELERRKVRISQEIFCSPIENVKFGRKGIFGPI